MKTKYQARFSRGEVITRNSDRVYDFAYLLEMPSPNEGRPVVVMTGFAKTRDLAEKAARGVWTYATQATLGYGCRTKSEQKAKTERNRAARPILRLEVVETEKIAGGK